MACGYADCTTNHPCGWCSLLLEFEQERLLETAAGRHQAWQHFMSCQEKDCHSCRMADQLGYID
jgi:hypothetical protein